MFLVDISNLNAIVISQQKSFLDKTTAGNSVNDVFGLPGQGEELSSRGSLAFKTLQQLPRTQMIVLLLMQVVCLVLNYNI